MGQKNCCGEGDHKFNHEHAPQRKDKNSNIEQYEDLDKYLSSVALKTKNSLPQY